MWRSGAGASKGVVRASSASRWAADATRGTACEWARALTAKTGQTQFGVSEPGKRRTESLAE